MLEVCVDSVQSAILAVAAGAQRIELSQSLQCGGLTPPLSLIEEVRSQIAVPLIVLIRCRDGNFVYSNNELDLMLNQITEAIANGADGVAVGAIDKRGNLDLDFIESAATLCPSQELVIHRAFDLVESQIDLLTPLVNRGVRRILTSGGPRNAIDGIEQLRKLQARAADQIEILPAGGIQSSNAAKLLTETRCKQLHGSFRGETNFASEGPPDPSMIRAVRQILDAYLQSRNS